MHILIAEDDTFLQKVYTAALEKAGYTVTCAMDGEEALAKMLEKKPDMLLLDALMPKKDGFQVLEEKRTNPAIASVPVIMLTSLEQEKDMERAATLGVANYFIKTNLDLDELTSIIGGVLPAKDTTSSLQQYRGAFVADALQSMENAREALEQLEARPSDPELLFTVMRLFHSVKSSSSLMGFGDLSARCLGMETRFKSIIDMKGAATAEDRRVGLETAARIEEAVKAL